MKNWRSYLFLGFVILLAAVITSRLFYLQVINRKFYQSQALGQQVGFVEVKGTRGQIFLGNSKDTKGNAISSDTKSLAINNDEWLAYAIGKKVTDKDAFAASLAEYFKEPKQSILDDMAKSASYAVLKKDLSQAEVTALKKLDLDGLYFESSQQRYYPQEDFASQVMGFVGGDGTGQYGLEGYYEDILKGKNGIREDKRGLGLIDGDDDAGDDLDGSDLYLTIDYNIQFQAEKLLAQAKRDIDIDSGQIIVMKPDTGRILAMANFPLFNPNAYAQQKDWEIFQNATVQKIFEPGSIFKPFSMAMALQEGKVTPDTTFYDSGSLKIGPDTVYNFDKESYGNQTLSGILEKSINTGAVFLQQKVSHQTFLDYLDRLGLNDKTGIDQQGEVASQNTLLRNGSDFVFATASFGQGIEMTPIQLVKAFSIFPNGGRMVKPYIVDKVVHGSDEQVTKPQVSGQIISEKTASQVTTMMTNVVERGFGNIAKIPGYYLAGKTGTAEVPYKDRKGYYPDRTIQSFLGFGPSLKPQFVILVKLDHPNVPKSALSAAPIFKKLAQYIIDYWQIPPDYDVAAAKK